MTKKEGSFKVIGLIMILSLLIAALWDQLTWLKSAIHYVLDPTAGFLLSWNLTLGMLVIVLAINIVTTIIQKYGTDQETLKELRKEQKLMQEEMKRVRDNPEKYLELQKKQMKEMPETFMKTLRLSMRAMVYTAVPFILFFRWFNDYFIAEGNPVFLGFMSWFVFYLITSIIFSSILKKWMNVV
jgi:uncharacterized membrane protein (DUF106 family)